MIDIIFLVNLVSVVFGGAFFIWRQHRITEDAFERMESAAKRHAEENFVWECFMTGYELDIVTGHIVWPVEEISCDVHL